MTYSCCDGHKINQKKKKWIYRFTPNGKKKSKICPNKISTEKQKTGPEYKILDIRKLVNTKQKAIKSLTC